MKTVPEILTGLPVRVRLSWLLSVELLVKELLLSLVVFSSEKRRFFILSRRSRLLLPARRPSISERDVLLVDWGVCRLVGEIYGKNKEFRILSEWKNAMRS